MVKSRPVAALAFVALFMVSAPAAFAQGTHSDASSSGTTGTFTVPLAAVLGPGEFHVGTFYSAAAYEAGDSALATVGIVGAISFVSTPGLEIFASVDPFIGLERDFLVQIRSGVARAIAPDVAPRLNDHPFATASYDTGFGDLRIGAKYKVAGELDAYDGMAILAEIKLPTSSTDDGIGTGKVGFSVGFAASSELAEVIGIGSYVGGTFRASPDEVNLGNSFDYGISVQIPTRFWISAIFEMTGSIVQDPDVIAGPVGGGVASGADPVFLIAGFRVSHDTGAALDVAYLYNANFSIPSALGDLPVAPGGGFAKLSFTNSRSEPVIFTGAPPMALPPVNRPPTISCRAERTTVRVGESVRLFADVSDPDGDDVTVTWNTQTGSINPIQGETVTWSSQGVRPSRGQVVARVSDGYGGTADCELTLTVEAAPPPPQPTILTFGCSEFPSGNTRIDNRCKAILDDGNTRIDNRCKAILDDVALRLRQNPRATAVITGHSDSTGSDEVNNVMSQERADNAETYLVDTHGIAGNRIETASAGSSEPMADNATAAGRLQNRRIVVVVTIPGQ